MILNALCSAIFTYLDALNWHMDVSEGRESTNASQHAQSENEKASVSLQLNKNFCKYTKNCVGAPSVKCLQTAAAMLTLRHVFE